MEKRLILNLNMDVGCERRCKMKMVDYKLMDGINDTLKEEKRYMAEIYRPLNAISMLEEEEVRKVYEKEMKEDDD